MASLVGIVLLATSGFLPYMQGSAGCSVKEGAELSNDEKQPPLEQS